MRVLYTWACPQLAGLRKDTTLIVVAAAQVANLSRNRPSASSEVSQPAVALGPSSDRKDHCQRALLDLGRFSLRSQNIMG